MTFDIACGAHVGTVVAANIEEAWHKLTGEKTDGFSKLARWRTRSDDGHRITSKWFYQTPEALDAEYERTTLIRVGEK